MAQIYAGAETVLALDPHMQPLRDMQATDPMDVGKLASAGGCCCFKSRCTLEESSSVPHQVSQKSLLRVSLQLTDCLFENRLSRNLTYIAVWNSLACRGTTKRADLDGIFAALLNLDPGKLFGASKYRPHGFNSALDSTHAALPSSREHYV